MGSSRDCSPRAKSFPLEDSVNTKHDFRWYENVIDNRLVWEINSHFKSFLSLFVRRKNGQSLSFFTTFDYIGCTVCPYYHNLTLVDVV